MDQHPDCHCPAGDWRRGRPGPAGVHPGQYLAHHRVHLYHDCIRGSGVGPAAAPGLPEQLPAGVYDPGLGGRHHGDQSQHQPAGVHQLHGGRNR